MQDKGNDQMAWVRNDDLNIAHARWREVWPCPMVCDWGTFVGEDHLPNMKKVQYLVGEDIILWEINDKGAERIKMIATSPHYETLLKAMAIKYVENIL